MHQSLFSAFPPKFREIGTQRSSASFNFFSGRSLLRTDFLSLIISHVLYVSIVFNVEEVADTAQARRVYAGIRPGRATAEYLTRFDALTIVGAVYLALVPSFHSSC